MKIKSQGKLTKFISTKISEYNKNKFIDFIGPNLVDFSKKIAGPNIDMDVVSFSSTHDYNEQILSILSFLRYVGIPKKWTLYSDGTHKEKQVQLIKHAFEFLTIEMIDFNAQQVDFKEALIPYKEELINYAKQQPLGKKLFYYLNHELNRPSLFIDSDILFYPKASVFNILLKDVVIGWYLLDPDWGCLDSRYKAQNQEQHYQVNSGFFFLKKEIEILKEGLDFLKSLNYQYEYFSEQNIFHILFRSNNFMPLDPRIFILNSQDQFDFSYLYFRDKIAIRHYTGPVRHKMWQKDWKWQLNLSKL